MTARELLESDWSYWPQGRYGLLAVAGWSITSSYESHRRPGVTFAIVDSADMDRVVERRIAGLQTVRKIRAKLCREVDALNVLETLE